jgi:hypothetical protein
VTPLQKVAMGLVIVLVDAFFGGYDAVPDPVGWVMVIAGLLPLRPRLESGSGLVVLAGLCLVVSVATYPPAVTALLDESGGWALSLPQIAFSYLLCTGLAPSVEQFSRRFLTLRWLFVALGAGPVLVFGGDVEVLRSPFALLGVGANLYLVYLLFRSSPHVAAGPTESKG